MVDQSPIPPPDARRGHKSDPPVGDLTTTPGGSGHPGQVSGPPVGSGELGEVPERSNIAATKRTVEEGAPLRESISYVRWKMLLSEDSFRGRLVELIPHADGFNLQRLRYGFPLEVAAYEAWMASPDGDFVLPVDPPGPRAEWTHPMCEDCWITTQERGALPYRLRNPEAETCCWCGRPATAGIYYRADSRRLAHHPEGGHGS